MVSAVAEDFCGGVEGRDGGGDARVLRRLHQHLDELLPRDAEVESAHEVALQLVGLSEGGQLGDGAEAAAAQVEAGPDAVTLVGATSTAKAVPAEVTLPQLLPAVTV